MIIICLSLFIFPFLFLSFSLSLFLKLNTQHSTFQQSTLNIQHSNGHHLTSDLWSGQILLDLAFFVLNVLTRNWVILTCDHLFSHCTCVLFGHIEVACARGRVQTDFDRGWLRHVSSPSARVPRLQSCGNTREFLIYGFYPVHPPSQPQKRVDQGWVD